MRRLQVNLTDSTLSTLKKWAAKSGKSASETARELIDSGLEARAIKESVPVSGLPPEAVMDVMKEVGHGVPPEALRYLVQDMAKTEDLLRQISRLLSEGGSGSPTDNFKVHEERVRIAEQKADRILKKLNLREVEDVDRFVLAEHILSKEETDQMLKEMGIGKDRRVMGAGGEK